ncbi:hypothetical protein McanMca71_002371 [Microsporum canis]|uniref:Mtf2-like C-terminal domain-containing protein n=1 Tax=Arthroderma otae (strain ATCC MYA-4605 / CBS 113480) TaxID=554155 RepID=C5FLC0_ARTOC|nr:conserved hypothetical protein [Microsporum canis CBS 113480]EEQ30492.1 conserved hypothetical protein [Microsporum canis CBS 113480]
MSSSRGLVSFWRESTHLPFLYLTQTLTTPVQRPQPYRHHQLASYPQRCPFSNSSRQEIRSHLGRRHTSFRGSTSSPTSRGVKAAGGLCVDHDEHIPPNDNLSNQENREITNIFTSVLSSMSEIHNPKSRKTFQRPLDTLTKSGIDRVNVNDKLHNFRFTEVDPSAPDEAKFAGIDLSVPAFAVAQKETKRICKEIDDAVLDGRGDLGIWKICENMIFPMLKQAGLDESQPPCSSVNHPTTTSLGDDVSGRLSTRPNGNGSYQSIHVHPDVPVVTVVRHVYPATLLHALRILQNKFPMSPLTTRLFESIRAHGRASLIMGSSKELFHELIDFRWRVYNDLPSIVSLLKEMEENGVDFDKRTLELVERIRQRGAREIMKTRQVDGRGRNSSIKGKNRRAGSGGSNTGGTWWDSPAIRKAYRELASWAKGMDAQIRDFKELEEKAQEIWSIKRP